MATITTTTTITPPISYELISEFLLRANQICVYPSVCMPGEYEKNGGSAFTMKWLQYAQQAPTVTPLAELTGAMAYPTRASSTPTVNNVTATLAKYGDYFLLNEESDFTNPSGQRMELMGVLGEQAGRSLNRLARDEMEGNLTARRVGGVATNGAIVSAMTRNTIAGTVAVLQANSARLYDGMTSGSQNVGSAPVRDAYRGICNTYVEEDISRLAGFIPVQSYSMQTEVKPGEFGMAGRVRWQSTEEASQSADTGGANAALVGTTNSAVNCDLFNSIILGRGAVGSVGLNARHPDVEYAAADPPATVEIIHKPRGSGGFEDPFNEMETIAWKLWAVFKIVQSSWGRRVVSGATSYA